MGAVKVLREFQETVRDHKIVAAPVQLKPYGLTTMLNILGSETKVCSFDCAYCNLGATNIRLNKVKDEVIFPTVAEIREAAHQAFQKLHLVGPSIEGLMISGNGEPTLHPDFPEVIRALIELRDQWLPGKPLRILTNGASLDIRKIAEALNLLDERIIKIDAGNEKMFKTMNSPLSRSTLSKVLLGVRKLKSITVRSTFVQGTVDNTQASDLEDWIEVIAMLKPQAVQIHGLVGKPAREGITACDEDTLYGIASRLERKTQLKATVIY